MTGLEFATGTEAVVIGKPNEKFFHEVLQSIDVAPGEAVLIGDVSLFS